MKQTLKDSIRYISIKTEDILPDINQPRKTFDQYELDLLADSIRQNGIIQPLTVRPDLSGRYILIAGERRLRAARQIGLKKVPCIIHRTDEMTAAFYSIIENLQRQNLSVFEEAEAINRLIIDYGISHSEVAEQLGLAQSTLSNKLRILKLDTNMRNRLVAARLTERHARALIRLPEEKREDVLNYILAQGLTLSESEKYIDNILEEKFTVNEKRLKKKSAIGDIRIFSNSLSRLLETMASSGINAQKERYDRKEYIEFRIKISKPPVTPEDSTQLKIC